MIIEDLFERGLKENAAICDLTDYSRTIKNQHRALIGYDALSIAKEIVDYGKSDLNLLQTGAVSGLEEKIRQGSRLARNFKKHNVNLDTAKQQIKQIAELTRAYESFLSAIVQKIYSNFSETYNDMKNTAKTRQTGRLLEQREFLNHLVQLFDEIGVLADRRGIGIGGVPAVLRKFIGNYEAVESLKEQVEGIREELSSTDISKNESKKKLKILYSDNFEEGIFRKTLLQKCRKVEYYDGEIIADDLAGQIRQLLKRKTRKAWTRLMTDIADLKRVIKYKEDMDTGLLKKTREDFNLQKYNNWAHLAPFSEKVSEYQGLARQFYDVVSGRIRQDNEYNKSLSRIKAKAELASTQAQQEKVARMLLEKRVEEEKQKRSLAEQNGKELESRYSSVLSEKQEIEKELEKEKGGFFYLDKDYVSQKKPTHDEFKALGKLIVSSYCGDVVKKFSRINDYALFLLDSGTQTDEQDAAYVQHLCQGIRLSMEKGNLSIELDSLNGDSEVIYRALESMEQFTGKPGKTSKSYSKTT